MATEMRETHEAADDQISRKYSDVASNVSISLPWKPLDLPVAVEGVIQALPEDRVLLAEQDVDRFASATPVGYTRHP